MFIQYLLVSPAPHLRIVFASSSLHSPTLIDSPIMSRIRGPQKLRQSVETALSGGECFTAKISWRSDISTVSTPSTPQHENKGINLPLRLDVARSMSHQLLRQQSYEGDRAPHMNGNSHNGTGVHSANGNGIGDVHEEEYDARMKTRTSKYSDQLGKFSWIHCTPMLDGKNRVGVWMIVMVKGGGGDEGSPGNGLSGEMAFRWN